LLHYLELLLLELIAILLTIHFSVPLVYFLYARIKWLKRHWNIKIDESHRPKVTVIIPTYNEAEYLEKKLDNIYEQNYPLDLMEIIIADDCSTDDTLEIVKKWCEKNLGVKVKITRGQERKGKIKSIVSALKHVTSTIVVISDADSLLDRNAIKNAVKYFADPTVGALTASLKYYAGKFMDTENAYRDLYNIIRVAESKVHSTPIHSGVFQVFRRDILEKISLHPKIEDSFLASYIAFTGYRAIQVDDVWAYEPLRGSYLKTKIRRAQHNIATFLQAKKYVKEKGVYTPTPFEKVWKMEWWLYIVNPWLLLACIILLITGTFYGSLTALILLGMGLTLLVLKVYRIWVLQQLYLVIAAVRNLWTREIVWRK
jgi:cellulose synthase/poly-beta-1,6-N-acetylglucosamine synthase-like glycosyltransferase